MTESAIRREVSFDDLPSLAGTTLGTSDAILIDQDRISSFAEATEDRQWIHVDPARAKDGPFGTTIAHGFLTLSLSTALLWQVLEVTGSAQVVNYGLDKVRFPAPVPAGAPLRMTVDVVDVDEVAGGYQLRYRGTATVPDQPKPVCVAEGLLRYYKGS